MVHRALQVVLGVALLAGTACSDGGGGGGGGNASAIRAVCGTRDKTQIAINETTPVGIDQYPKIIEGLAAAIKVAPADIRPDFVLVHRVLKPFVEALVKAGDAQVAAQDPAFQKLAADIGTKEATTAANDIAAYYDKHCGKKAS